jgi:hypothetical protein
LKEEIEKKSIKKFIGQKKSIFSLWVTHQTCELGNAG